MHSRSSIADLIVARLQADAPKLKDEYASSRARYFAVDNLLPEPLAAAIHAAFPPVAEMMLRSSLRERKYVTSQMNKCEALAEEAVFAFQDPRIVQVVSAITGIQQLEPDAQLYAGGISLMGKGHFLNPHVDNSHDKSRERYRVLNLLYYVSPEWQREFGGSLELWPDGTRQAPVVLPSLFNRLIVMATTTQSWHSVNQVNVDRTRCCVSNYYFSRRSPEKDDYFHVTSFRGRPEQPMRDLVLRADAALRMLVRQVAKRGLVETKHYYKQ